MDSMESTFASSFGGQSSSRVSRLIPSRHRRHHPNESAAPMDAQEPDQHIDLDEDLGSPPTPTSLTPTASAGSESAKIGEAPAPGSAPSPPAPPAKRHNLLDEDLLSSQLSDLIAANGVVELRLLGAKRSSSGWGSRPTIESGYFDSAQTAVDALMPFESWTGAYATLNPVPRDLLARASNRFGAQDSTKDHEVARRTQLLIDVDPVRSKGISSTDAQHEAAIQRAREIADYLSGDALWPAPVLIDSGNGAHLRYSIDLPRDDGGFVKRVLGAVALRNSSPSSGRSPSTGGPAPRWRGGCAMSALRRSGRRARTGSGVRRCWSSRCLSALLGSRRPFLEGEEGRGLRRDWKSSSDATEAKTPIPGPAGHRSVRGKVPSK